MDSTQTVIDGNGRSFIYFESTGHLSEFYTYKDGIKNGDFEEYTAVGKPFVIGQYLDGEQNGPWTYWYYVGTIDRQVNYLNGKLHGDYQKNY